jgi:hypothetical protein
MFKSAKEIGISPLRLSFTGSMRVVRREEPQFQQAPLLEIKVFFSWLIEEISDQKIPAPQNRVNPRVVKKSRSKFKSRKRYHRGNGTPRKQLSFLIFKTAS